MAHAESSITINRPVSDVYAFLLDGTKNLLWRPGVLDIERVPGKPAGVGAVFKQGVKGPGGRRLEADYEIIEAKTNQTIRFQVIAGPARPIGTYNFTSADNSTTVKFTLHNDPKGLMGVFMNGMINRTMQGEVALLSNLKSILENQH